MDPQADGPISAIPRLVRNLLAQDAGLLAFFDRIAVADAPSYEMPFVLPSLLVYPLPPGCERVAGGNINLAQALAVQVVLPRLTPTVPDFAAPSAPAVSAGAAGPLTGAYSYRLTEFGAAGESNASEATSVALSAQAGSVTIPALTTGTGHRVWRSKAGKTAARWAGTVFGGSTTWTDTVLDAKLGAELAPVLLLPEKLSFAIAAACFAAEYLSESGQVHADVCQGVEIATGKVVPVRNVWAAEVRPTFLSYYDPITGHFLTETQ